MSKDIIKVIKGIKEIKGIKGIKEVKLNYIFILLCFLITLNIFL